MASLDLTNVKKRGYRLVIDNGFFILYKDGHFPVMVSDNPIAVVDWMIENTAHDLDHRLA